MHWILAAFVGIGLKPGTYKTESLGLVCCMLLPIQA